MERTPDPFFASPWVADGSGRSLAGAGPFLCQHGYGHFPLRILPGFMWMATRVVRQARALLGDGVVGFSVGMSPLSARPSAQFVVVWRDPEDVPRFSLEGPHRIAMDRYGEFFPDGIVLREARLTVEELPAPGDGAGTRALYRRLRALPPRA